jgi:hypothetical protein
LPILIPTNSVTTTTPSATDTIQPHSSRSSSTAITGITHTTNSPGPAAATAVVKPAKFRIASSIAAIIALA